MAATMTLVEYAKGLPMGESRAVVEQFARSSDIFGALPIEGLSEGNPVYQGMREKALPSGLAFRGINEAGTSGQGLLEAFSEPTYVFDHDIDIDRAIIDRHGAGRADKHSAMAIAAAGKLWTDTFLAGDNSTQPREFDGLAKRAGRFSNRTMANSAASGGAALSLYSLDKAIGNTVNPTHIICSWNMFARWSQAARTPSVSGYVVQSYDEMGAPKFTYNSIPILFGYKKDKHGVILPFNEVASGGGSAVTASLYVVSFAEMGMFGVQLKPMQVTPRKLLENGTTSRQHMSWDTGIVDEHEYCMTRLNSITDAPFVA